MKCIYCNNPLVCESCSVDYEPRTPEEYETMARAEVPVDCPECESRLVCHWCKTPYDAAEIEEGLA